MMAALILGKGPPSPQSSTMAGRASIEPFGIGNPGH